MKSFHLNEIKQNPMPIASSTSSWQSNLAQSIYNFFTKPTAKKSQREEYYQRSNCIAEYWCTLSNVGLFTVGCYYKDFATLTAATCSALSHAFPKQWLHHLDMIGVAGVLIKAIANYKTLSKRPGVIATGSAALLLNFLDTYITRKYLAKVGPWLHVAWHLAAAYAIAKLDQAILDNVKINPQFKM